MSQAGKIIEELEPTVATSFVSDAGTAIPALNSITLAGGANISTSAAGDTVLFDVSGTTDHAIQIGNSTGSLTSVGPLTAGQILVGTSATTDPVPTTIIAGSNVTITNTGDGTLTIASSGGGGGGGVTSVSGTAARITSTGGATPVIDIDAAYVGQASITTLGTITSGTWNGTDIAVADGGTGNNTFTAYSVICAGTAATNPFQNVSGLGTATHVLTSNGTGLLPTWQAPSGGGGSSVSGTLNRITSTGGATPVIDIDAAYVGQASITTLGTVTTGTWNATDVPLSAGGTNASLVASDGGIFYSTAAAGAILSGTATAGQMLRSGASTAPTWSTATFPATATGTGTILRADGTNWVASTSTYPDTNAVSTLLYASATNVMSALATANNGVLITSATGVPSMLAAGTTGQVLTATTGSPASWAAPATNGTVTSVSGTANQVAVATGTTTPVISLIGPYTPDTYTVHGVLIGAGNSSIVALGAGTAGQVLQSSGAGVNPAYSTATYPTVATGTSKVLVADGTNWVASTPTFPNASATSGKFIRSDGTNWIASTPTLPTSAGTAGKILMSDATNYIESTTTYPTTNAVSTLLYASSANVMGALATANNGTLVTGNTGIPSILAGPGTTGNILQSNAAAAPSFSTATYPATTTINQILYSSAANVVGGITTAINGVLITSNGGVPSILANSGTAGWVLTANSGAPPSWSAAAAGGLVWSAVTVDASFTVNTGIIANKAGLLTMTLPASAALGDIIEITGINSANGWKISQNANQQIFFGNQSTTVGVGGSLASTAIRDSVKLLCVVAGASSVYNIISSVGNITVV